MGSISSGMGGAGDPCETAMRAATHNVSWRMQPLAAYKTRLKGLLTGWRECRARRPAWRGIFQLAHAPRARALSRSRLTADCEVGQLGMASQIHSRAAVNVLARQMVEAAGFEVFDPFAATLHADPGWFDRTSSGGALPYATEAAEALSDLITQLLIHQLCRGESKGLPRLPRRGA